jgi:hypothetical protein
MGQLFGLERLIKAPTQCAAPRTELACSLRDEAT